MHDFMIYKREELGLTRQEMAKQCECSPYLLELLEEGENEITHPQVAARIAREYGLSVDEYQQLVHPKRRTGKIPKIKKLSGDIFQALRDGYGEAGHE